MTLPLDPPERRLHLEGTFERRLRTTSTGKRQ